jgi:restriction system protein
MSPFYNAVFQGFIASVPTTIDLFVRTWYVWLFFVSIAAISIGFKVYQRIRLSRAGILDIDKMTPVEFEERLIILFTNLGYKAERTVRGPTKPDYGVDLIVEIDNTRYAVQAKCYNYKNDTVKEKAVQEAYAGKNYYNCTEAMVVTNSYFTKAAIKLALSDDIQLWNRDMLINVLLKEKSLKNNLTS